MTAPQTYFDGEWLEGNPGLLGPMSHALWLGSCVFDGARAFEGVAPDLDLHCQRVINSARVMGLAPALDGAAVEALARQGIARFDADAELYIRPMFWAESGFVAPDPATTRFALSVYESPLPKPTGSSAAVSTRRRPTPETAPTEAKAACLYPQSGLALREAIARGFQNAIVLDQMGNVAEFATANLFIAKDGVVATPAPNGCFLDGVTRRRIIGLLRADGVEIREKRVTVDDVLAADEVFSTGNHGKLLPYTRVEDCDYQPGPVYERARRLYWDYAHSR
ncbi:MAG: branched-chain amino acid aminotransferase [Inquilinus sp.]|nr:branched-chain amino acid aminotransferase [Inquilinus sp.]